MEWKKSYQDAELKLKSLGEFEATLKRMEDELAQEEMMLKRQDGMVKKWKDSQDEVRALKDAAEVKRQAEIKQQNDTARIERNLIKELGGKNAPAKALELELVRDL